MFEYPIPSSASDPLVLSGTEPFARGGKRHCYVHPADPSLCVKVAARADDERCHAEQRTDIEDYRTLTKCWPEAVFDRIPAITGVVGTDLGPGIVMPLYRDGDGRISRNLGEIVREGGLTPSLLAAIDELKGWLRKYRLLTRDSGPHNVVAVRLGEERWKLVLIEDWLNRRHRWLARRHRAILDYLIGRELRKFDRRLAHSLKARRDGA